MTNTKKKKGNKMKLLSAVGMLTVSAAMLVSSTFAWFSMNRTVRASTMSISAKSDSTFLLIGDSTKTTAAAIQADGATSVTNLGTAGDYTQLIPSTPAVAADITAYGDDELDGSVAVTNLATAAVQANWWTANSDDPDNATTNTINVTPLTADNFNQYVIKKTVNLTVAVGANNANNLSITPTFAASNDAKDYSGIKVLVVTNDGAMAILDKDSGKTDIKGTNTAITPATVRQVDLYIYYDGKDSTVKTSNYANLVGADVTFAFDVDVVPAT